MNLIVFLLGQSILALIWAAMTHAKLSRACADIADLKDLRERMARMEGGIEGLRNEFRSLNDAISWMKRPAMFGDPPPKQP